jgi:site-specific DNA recombinase
LNTQVRTDRLEEAVWQQVCRLLEDPTRLTQEYERRLQAVQSPPEQADLTLVERQLSKLRQGITRLIDGYTEGYIDKGEFEPRIRRFKERLQTLEARAKQLYDDSQQQAQLQLIIGRLEEFSAKVKAGLDRLDWHGRRDMIRTLVKRVEIDREQVNVVFRVEDMTIPSGNKPFLQDCWRLDHRRFWPIVTFDSVLEIAARVEARTYRDLYGSARAHLNLV